MKGKKFWVSVITGISCATVSLLSLLGVTIAWFSTPNLLTEDEEYLDGNIGLRNYFFSGDGSAEKPYEIVSPIHFYNLTRLQNLGIFSKKNYFQVGHYFDLDDDPNTPAVLRCINGYDPETGEPNYQEYLDMNNWPSTILPIGSESAPFVGNFDGLGMPIKNLTVSGYPEDIGVFGYIAHNAKVTGLVCSDLTVTSLGYNSNSQSKDNMLFSEDIDNIFADASYFDTAYVQFFRWDGEGYVLSCGGYENLKHLNGNTGTPLIDSSGDGINNPAHMIVAKTNPETGEPIAWYFNGYFTYTEPTYNKPGKDPFTYSWKSSSPLIKMSEILVNGQKRIVIDLTPLRDSSSFNSGDSMQVDAKLSLIASVEVDGFVFSRVIQSYTIEFYSNRRVWADNQADSPKYYTGTIYCDYVNTGADNDINTNYHHGNNIGFLAGHCDGTMENCYVYNGNFVFNNFGEGRTKIPTETDSGLIGEIGTNVKNNIEADIGLVVDGDTGIMNFSKIYSLIRNDFVKSNVKGTLSSLQELPPAPGDYYFVNKVTDRFYLVRKDGEWHGGLEEGGSTYSHNPDNIYGSLADYSSFEFTSTNHIGQSWFNANNKGGIDTAVPNDSSKWRVKNMDNLYVVWTGTRWEPHFTITWDSSVSKWQYASTNADLDGRLLGETNHNKRPSNIKDTYGFTLKAPAKGDVYLVNGDGNGNYYVFNGTNWEICDANINNYKGGHDREENISYYSYNNVINSESFDMFADYLRYYTIEDGQKQYIAKTGENLDYEGDDRTWRTMELPSKIPQDYNSVDFLWNKVIQDEKGKDRGLGVFKVVSSYNLGAKTGEYFDYRFANFNECTIKNGTAKDKVYFSTAEFDHSKGDYSSWSPLRGSTTPSYSDYYSFEWPFSRDYNYCFELDLSQMDESAGNNYMWNTKSEFLENYLASKLIDKYGVPITSGARFGFMFRSSENELLESLSSYMPVGKPGTKHEFTTYYKWDGETQKWLSSETTPSGTNKGTISNVKDLPDSPEPDDFYKVTAYYPSNSIVFRVENKNGANVSVVGRGDDITIYGYDPVSSSNDIEALYTMKSASQTGVDAHKYFTYDMATGATGSETVQYGKNMGDDGALYAHIFKLKQGDYVIGAKNNSANIYFLGVQGQTDGTIGGNDVATVGNGVKNVEFLLEEPLLSDYIQGTGISGSKIASATFKARFNDNIGTFSASSFFNEQTGRKYLKLSFNNETNTFVTYLLTYISNPDRQMYVNNEFIRDESHVVEL